MGYWNRTSKYCLCFSIHFTVLLSFSWCFWSDFMNIFSSAYHSTINIHALDENENIKDHACNTIISVGRFHFCDNLYNHLFFAVHSIKRIENSKKQLPDFVMKLYLKQVSGGNDIDFYFARVSYNYVSFVECHQLNSCKL